MPSEATATEPPTETLDALEDQIRCEAEGIERLSAPACLSDALECGGIRYGVSEGERRALLGGIADALTVSVTTMDFSTLRPLTATDLSGFVAVGDGIAVPHPSFALLSPAPRPAAVLMFLSEPMAVAGPDGQWIDTIFVNLSPSRKSHLDLLSQTAAMLRDVEFRTLLRDRAPVERLFDAVRHAERTAFAPPSPRSLPPV